MFFRIFGPPYKEFNNIERFPLEFGLGDHLGGFSQGYTNELFEKLQSYASLNNINYKIYYHQIIDKNILSKYPNLELIYDLTNKTNRLKLLSDLFHDYTAHPSLNYKNFICSFNGSPHVSRKLLVSILKKFGYFNEAYCSKNFSYTTNKVDGHITDYVGNQDTFYRKFFISHDSEEFFQSINSFGHIQYEHQKNIYNLESKLTESFLHVVSETMATSYVPFVTEKFLYSIVTRGLFLAYAQPGWHDHVEKYYGFKKYTKLFDYRFDMIQNPVERLVELITMISKFSMLSTDEWQDLYRLENETIEYNYNHYFSREYLKHISAWI